MHNPTFTVEDFDAAHPLDTYKKDGKYDFELRGQDFTAWEAEQFKGMALFDRFMELKYDTKSDRYVGIFESGYTSAGTVRKYQVRLNAATAEYFLHHGQTSPCIKLGLRIEDGVATDALIETRSK